MLRRLVWSDEEDNSVDHEDQEAISSRVHENSSVLLLPPPFERTIPAWIRMGPIPRRQSSAKSREKNMRPGAKDPDHPHGMLRPWCPRGRTKPPSWVTPQPTNHLLLQTSLARNDGNIKPLLEAHQVVTILAKNSYFLFLLFSLKSLLNRMTSSKKAYDAVVVGAGRSSHSSCGIYCLRLGGHQSCRWKDTQ